MKHIVIFNGIEADVISENNFNNQYGILGVFQHLDTANDFKEAMNDCIINNI